jgi:hypothetical protein
MRRWIAILWHASFLVLAGGLYFFFVLPRWYELMGEWSHTLGTAMRITCGVLIGLAALPVVFTWLRTRRPEFGTPALALTLRLWSIVLHVVAAVLIVGAAISEIWLDLDTTGQWLFGIYGAAAAITLLGAFGFYLAFVAELPPPPPKPLKPKRTRRRGAAPADQVSADEASADEDADEDAVSAAAATETEPAKTEPSETEPSETDEPSTEPEAADAPPAGNADDADTDKDDETSAGRLRNRRPGGKSSSRLFRRSRGGVALDD